jgi:CheY-like chemotaxis protein
MLTLTLRVLIADDEPGMRRAISTALSARGYCTEEVRTGKEAICAMRERPSDVVLLDVNMPGISGIEACRGIRLEISSLGHHHDYRA